LHDLGKRAPKLAAELTVRMWDATFRRRATRTRDEAVDGA
jgi:hypothetical protein